MAATLLPSAEEDSLSPPSSIVEVVDILVDVSATSSLSPLNGRRAKPGRQKIDIIRTALQDQVAPKLTNGVAWGLKFFGGDCNPPQIIAIPPALRSIDELKAQLDSIPTPRGKTPLAAA